MFDINEEIKRGETIGFTQCRKWLQVYSMFQGGDMQWHMGQGKRKIKVLRSLAYSSLLISAHGYIKSNL